MFIARLDGNFMPPKPCNYVFGISAGSQLIGILEGSSSKSLTLPNETKRLPRAPALKPLRKNWGLLFAAVSQQPCTLFPPLAISTLAVQILRVPNSPVASTPGVVFGVLYNSSGSKARVQGAQVSLMINGVTLHSNCGTWVNPTTGDSP